MTNGFSMLKTNKHPFVNTHALKFEVLGGLATIFQKYDRQLSKSSVKVAPKASIPPSINKHPDTIYAITRH